MLNRNLPASELHESLDKYLVTMDFILKEIGESQRSLVDNKHLMGQLHHALNISNYSKPPFRENLLRHAKKDELLRFFHSVGLSYSASMEPDRLFKTIKKASKIPWEDNDETRSFIEIFGYDKNLIPIRAKSHESIQVIEKPKTPFKTLKDYQSEIFFQSMDIIRKSWSRLIIHMPTGAGKTRTAIEIIADFLNTGLENGEELQVVWIADKDELCEQAIETMDDIWSHVGKKDIPLYRLWGSNKFTKFEDFSFIVATYQTLNNLVKNNQTLPKPHLIVSDEAHNVIAPTHKHVLRQLEERQTRIIGLTATPIRGINTNENRQLLEYFEKTIIKIDSGDINTIEYLQRKGYLSYYIPKTIQSHRKFTLTKEQRRQYEKDSDLPSGFLDELANDQQRNIIILDNLKKLHAENVQVLYFATSLKQSKLMCALLISLGAKAAHVDGSTPMEYRRDVVEKFRRGEIKFIFNYNIFSIGFDAPNIDVVFIARPTTSIVLHQQMIGRGMRGPKMGGTHTFRLYRVVDDLPMIELADDYFSDIWNQK